MFPVKSGESYRKWNLLRLRFDAASNFTLRRLSSAFYERIAMKQERLNLYLIDRKYIRNLTRADDHVMSVSPQTGKKTDLLLVS